MEFTLNKKAFMIPSLPASFKDLGEARTVVAGIANLQKSMVDSLREANLGILQLDGGVPQSVYGGTTPIDGGGV